MNYLKTFRLPLFFVVCTVVIYLSPLGKGAILAFAYLMIALALYPQKALRLRIATLWFGDSRGSLRVIDSPWLKQIQAKFDSSRMMGALGIVANGYMFLALALLSGALAESTYVILTAFFSGTLDLAWWGAFVAACFSFLVVGFGVGAVFLALQTIETMSAWNKRPRQ
tara:strand:- start:554 stop:1057 length:504 start_codon:yes stop_codon:yes gene_type:complete